MSPAGQENTSRGIIRRPGLLKPMLRDYRFWGVQCLVLVIAITHQILEGIDPLYRVLYFLPVGVLWLPMVYAALTFGSAGAVGTGLWATVTAIPEWVLLSTPSRPSEIAEMVVLIIISFVVGRQVDIRMEAMKRAAAYAAFALQTQEQERLRLSHDLHDDTIQHLVLVCQELDILRNFGEPLPPATLESLQAVKNDIIKTITGVRNITMALRPPILDDLGLVISVRRLLADLAERAKLQTQLEVVGAERRLSAQQETGLFRIAQEALRNVERHARATSVEVKITFAERESVLSIVDNGIGFEVRPSVGQMASSEEFGLLSMFEYAETLGGRFKIESRPGKGTSVSASIPQRLTGIEERPEFSTEPGPRV